jgi:hypothetical protein
MMGDEVQLISDGDGLAVIGPQNAVAKYLKSAGQWASSQELDLRRLKPLLGVGADIAQEASEIAASSGRWIKLTEESARLVQENGLMPSKTPGQSHLMVGVPGRVQNWLQTEQDLGPLLTNPAALSGLGGIMAQAAMRQTMAEITDYLAKIDQKVDDLLRKVDDTVVAQMVGAGHAIERALTIRDETGGVNETLWSTVDQAHQTIGATQTYALNQLDAIAEKLESTKVGRLAKTAEQAEHEVPKWLAVLARCFQLQDAIDVIELDRVLAESQEGLAAYRRGLKKAQQERRELIAGHTADLLGRMEVAVGTANAKMVWNRTKSLEVVESANDLATGIHDFHGLLRIESEPQSWDARQLGRGADIGSQAIQVAKDKGPIVVTAASVGLAGLTLGKKLQDEKQP